MMLEVGVWCYCFSKDYSINFFFVTINSHQCDTHILTPFFEHLWENLYFILPRWCKQLMPQTFCVLFYYICPTNAQDIYKYLFLKALLHVLMFIHHSHGVLLCFSKLTNETFIKDALQIGIEPTRKTIPVALFFIYSHQPHSNALYIVKKQAF